MKPKKKKHRTTKTFKRQTKKDAKTEWRKSIKKKKKFYKPTPPQEWTSFKPEPDTRGRSKLVVKVDVVKLGGVGKALEIAKLKKKIKKLKRTSGAVRGISFKGSAIGAKGEKHRKKRIDRKMYVKKGVSYDKLVDEAFADLKKQIEQFNWVVSEKARRKKKIKGERIKSLPVEFRYVELISKRKRKRRRKRK